MGVDRRQSSRRPGSHPPPARWRTSLLAGIALASLAGPAIAVAASAGAATGRLTVTTTLDELTSGDGTCSLREAIATVDSPGTTTDCGTASSASNTIVLRAGQYALSIAPRGGDHNSTGDLNISGRVRLTITGAGSAATIINAEGLGDRVISIAGGARVTLRRLRLTGGRPPAATSGSAGVPGVSCGEGGGGGHGYNVGSAGEGGGIYNAGTLVLDRVAVVRNSAGAGGAGGAGGSQSQAGGCGGGAGGAGGSGGGIYNQGTLTVTDSTVRGNEGGLGGPGGVGGGSASAGGGQGGTAGQGGSGGGIYNQGALTVTDSTIDDNRAGAGATAGAGGTGAGVGGIDGTGGPGAPGGGIFSIDGSLTVRNSTLANNFAGQGGPGGGLRGTGGNGGDGGAVAVTRGVGSLLNATVADNRVGGGGGSFAGHSGASGYGGGLFVESTTAAHALRLQNTIVASNLGLGCAGTGGFAIQNAGHDLSFPDGTCPGRHGNPRLGPLRSNGGWTNTMSLRAGSAAINAVPGAGAGCPPTDQRGLRRPQGPACDIGAFEVALPTITLISPGRRASYERGSRVRARFRCTEGGSAKTIVTCRGTVSRGRLLATARSGTHRFVVTAIDRSGHRLRKTVRYSVWEYVNPLRLIGGLSPERIDMGVDYAGSGPLLALGAARVTMATNNDAPPLCSGITCWPGGGVVVYRLLDGPFEGRYVFVAENITAIVRRGQMVRAGQRIATLHDASPNMETGWGSGRLGQTLAIADGHQCTCGDPGGWSSIEGRNFNRLLVRLGAPSGVPAPNPPNQSMPRGWPTW